MYTNGQNLHLESGEQYIKRSLKNRKYLVTRIFVESPGQLWAYGRRIKLCRVSAIEETVDISVGNIALLHCPDNAVNNKVADMIRSLRET